MLDFKFVKVLRKYWYIAALLLLALVAGLICYLHQTDADPVTMLRRFGYPIIIGWTFLEGETIVILAGSVSRRIGLKPELVALCAFSGSFASDQLMFSLGKYKGDAVLKRFPKLGKNIERAAGLFKKYDTALILGFRFVYGVRNVTPILLGISGVSHKKFFILNFIGAAVWSISFTYGGLYLGKAFIKAVEHFGKGFFVFLLAFIVVGGVIWHIRRRSVIRHHESISAKSRADSSNGWESAGAGEPGSPPASDEKSTE